MAKSELRFRLKRAASSAAFMVGLSAIAVTAASAQSDNGRNPLDTFTQDHRPNEFTQACLQAPSAKCAIEAALQTVIAEQLGGERSRVLVAVSEALIEQGKLDQAKQTLMVALEEAENSGLSLIYQEKLQQIAPLLARAGDPASALAVAGEARYGNIKDRVLRNVAREVVRLGDISAMRVSLQQLRNNRRAFWEEMTLLVEAPATALQALDLDSYLETIETMKRSDRRYRGYILLSALEFKRGNPDLSDQFIRKADGLFDRFVNNALKMEIASRRLDAMRRAGMPAEALEKSYALAIRMDTPLVQGVERWAFEELVMPYEAETGRLDLALSRLDQIIDLDRRTRFMETIIAAKAEPMSVTALTDRYSTALNDIRALETVFDRDLARFSVLKAAVGNGLAQDALQIVAQFEDDDSQAAALALASGILP